MSNIICKHCGSESFVKNGFVQGRQRFECKRCFKTFREGDNRERYDDEKRQKVLNMYLEGISNPLIIKWIRKFGNIIKDKVRNLSNNITDIKEGVAIMEIDELVTWIKKNQKEIKKPKKLSMRNIHSYGLLQIGTSYKLLILK